MKTTTKMKDIKRIISVSLALALTLSGCGLHNSRATTTDPFADDINESVSDDSAKQSSISQELFHDNDLDVDYGYKIDGKYIAIYDGDDFKQTYLNGVNIGSGVPGFFPGELAITYEEYFRWFKEIADMNCNTIRIYTTMKPCFYEALKKYNETYDNKLYLIMGVWYDEDKVVETGDAYDVLDGAIEEAKEQIDIIHGDCEISERVGKAYGTYKADVADYVLGWILGIESDANFVGTTIDEHPDITSYDGKYLYCEDTDAFHAFLCELGDETIKYETEKYGMQRPVSFANWPTADEISHPEEPLFEMEDAVSINVEHIKTKATFAPGLFASYHVYPYYPDFMILEEKYTTHKDANGDINTYEGYLQDLMSIHTVPVMVAEYGVPTSRGCTHINKYNHYDQGHLNEKEQGEALAHMAQDIFDNGYCGGIVFTWQDEWFKRTWNTMDYTDPDRRPFWSDIQTSEQNFGLLSFDPGKDKMTVLIDGKYDDWENEEAVCKTGKENLYLKYDERYLYFCVQGEGFDPEKDRVVIPIDLTPNSGSDEYGDHAFDRKVDFVVDLNGKEESTVLVHKYYDRYAFTFGEYDDLFDATGYDDPDSKEFVPIYLNMNRQQWIPTTGETKHAEKMDTGLLKYGNGSPNSEDYDSLADFIYGDGFVEGRIPWGVLSFRDPSSKEVEADFWKNGGLMGQNIKEIYVGLNDGEEAAVMKPYTWDDWTQPEYHERLKQSYGILKEKYGELVIK